MLSVYSTVLSFATAIFAGFIDVEGVKSPFLYDGGDDVGVSFGGFHASAGLGGLLGGGAAGGLHAEAGTPFAQSASAGLGGVVSKGSSAGTLFAAADSGTGAKAGVVTGGIVSSAAAGGSITAIKEEVTKPRTTYIERTVIPNYVEKTVQIPSYIEKTIRVPTVVEEKVRVPAPPTVIEKVINQPSEVIVSGNARKPDVYKSVSGFGATAGAGTYHAHNFYDGGYGGRGSAVLAFRKSNLINDIFNIPISTLTAVNRLVGGIASGASGSVSVSKQVVV